MRTYKVRIINDNGKTYVEERSFTQAGYEGVHSALALVLVNEWNREVQEGPEVFRPNGVPRFVYWL